MRIAFRGPGLLTLFLCGLALLSPTASGARFQWLGRGSDAENQAIRYSTSSPSESIARLQQAMDAGGIRLQFDAKGGYLRSVLRALNIPLASQSLVFSRTSFQRQLISPQRPRALYFNHDVYVGWVPGGRVLEIASVDPNLGVVFYTLNQERTAHPTFERQTQTCLQCHDSPSVTGGVPGLIMRSVYPDAHGEPIASAGTFLTSDSSALRERWGGWYVTGTHGSQVHMGNLIAEPAFDGVRPDLARGANLTDLRTRIDTRPYLSEHSDIVALMVLEHQNHLHNLMTRASYHTRMALHFDQVRNQELGRPADYAPESTIRLVRDVAEPLVRAMLFVDEAALTEPVSGTTAFAREFADGGPRSRSGRSLLELDLKRRLFRHPCSYVIYSASFDALPALTKHYVYRRLGDVLSGADTSGAFAHLSAADRSAIRNILLETKPDFAAWNTTHAAG